MKGFTLVEILVSMSLIVIIGGFSIPVFQTFQFSNEVEQVLNYSVSALKKAQVYSQTGKDDSEWSVAFESGRITLFRGNDYQTREQDFDEEYRISPLIVFSGNTIVSFNKIYGETTSSTIAITFNDNNRTLTINEKGIINY